MARLRKIPFTEDLLSNEQVQAFSCGTEEWEIAVADVLKRPKGSDGLLDIASAPGANAWLYIDEAGSLVGFGSIGPGSLKWPKPKFDPIPSSVIPWLGVATNFRRRGFGKEILLDLINVAQESAATRRIVVLSVHAENPAVKLYTDHNFVEYGKPRRVPSPNGPLHARYVLDLWPTGQPPPSPAAS